MSTIGAGLDGEGRLGGPTSNFLVAFRVLPRDRREAIRVVYGFCRDADDAVDEASGPGEACVALSIVRRRLDEAFRGDGSDPEARRLAAVVEAYGLPRRPFEDLLEGVTWDLEGRRYADGGELREYCRRVASTVGLLCIRIFGCEDPACERYAEELGVALQWTNILRDIGEDLVRGRVYLPQDSLRRHALAEDDLRLRDPEVRHRLDGLIREQAAYARSRFAAAREALPPGERPRVLAGEIMAAVYRRLLAKIERCGSSVLDRKPRVSAARRGWIAARMLLWSRLGPSGGDAR